MEKTLAPGSPEAKAALAKFVRESCRYSYHDGGRCTERATYPPDDPKYCCKEHARQKGRSSRLFNARLVDVDVKV